MVRAEDASKINRIVQRFEISTVKDTAKIVTEIEKTRENKQKEEKNIGVQTKDLEEKDKEKSELAPLKKDENEPIVPLVENYNKENQLKSSSKMLERQEGNIKPKRKSIREALKELKIEVEKLEKQKKEKALTPQIKSKEKTK